MSTKKKKERREKRRKEFLKYQKPLPEGFLEDIKEVKKEYLKLRKNTLGF